MDLRVVGLASLLILATSLVIGAGPAFRAGSQSLTTIIKEGAEGRSGSRLQQGLVVSEMALALMLLIGAGLLTRSFQTLTSYRPNFDTSGLVTVWLLTDSERYPRGSQVVGLHDLIGDEVGALPGVESVGRASAGPFFGGRETTRFTVEGQAAPRLGEEPGVRYYDVGPDYLPTLGVPLVAGRHFNSQDEADAPKVAIVNESLVRRHLAGTDPIGRRLNVRDTQLEIVGVVADVPPLRPGDDVPSEIYWPQVQWPRFATYLVIRTATDPAGLIGPIRDRIKEVAPDTRVASFRTFDRLIGSRLVAPRFNMLLLGLFALIALAVAAVGLYGVIAYNVSMRTREIGVRMSLGADRTEILRLIVRDGLKLAGLGVGLGLAGALGLTRLMTSLLAGISASDPPTFVGIALVLVVVAIASCYLPARRASRVDPTTALRAE